MTGTGTETDPYIVDNWEDFVTAVQTAGAYVKLGADIDLNGTEYMLSFTPLNIYCADIDGDGHSISNIYHDVPTGLAYIFYVSTAFTMRDLALENVCVCGNSIELFCGKVASPGAQLTNCIIRGKLTVSGSPTNSAGFDSLMMSRNSILKMKLCTVALDITIQQVFPLFNTYATVDSSQLRINLKCLSQRTVNTSNNALFQGATVSNSYMFGTIEQDSEEPGTIYFSWDGTFSNFYQVVEYKNISTSYWNSIIGTVCFYDSNVAGDVTIEARAAYAYLIHGLTSEQCKSAEYLQSIGYACEGGD